MTEQKIFAMVGLNSKELITYRGKVIVHNSRPEMEFLFTGVRIVRCPDYVTKSDRIRVRDHPDFSMYKWPLRLNKFNNGGKGFFNGQPA